MNKLETFEQYVKRAVSTIASIELADNVYNHIMSGKANKMFGKFYHSYFTLYRNSL